MLPWPAPICMPPAVAVLSLAAPEAALPSAKKASRPTLERINASIVCNTWKEDHYLIGLPRAPEQIEQGSLSTACSQLCSAALTHCASPACACCRTRRHPPVWPCHLLAAQQPSRRLPKWTQPKLCCTVGHAVKASRANMGVQKWMPRPCLDCAALLAVLVALTCVSPCCPSASCLPLLPERLCF